MDTPIIEQFFRFVLFVIVLGLIVRLGWDEPLKYRFMSRAEVVALENPPAPVQAPSNAWMWDKKDKNSLEQGAYRNRVGDRGTRSH